MENVIKTFGIWQVTEDGMNSTEPYEYNLNIGDLFATRVEDGKEVWDFPIHLTEKTWLNGEFAYRMQDFNKAFAFAQEHFKDHRPARKANVSDSYTLQLQRLMMD
jgi:hypothetical protein